MNILLLYPKVPWTTAQYCEKVLRKGHHVETFDLLSTPNYITRLGKSFSRGRNIDISTVLKQCERQPDLIIEMDGEGAHHLAGYNRIKIPRAYWAIDSYIKFDFQKNIAPDFDYIFVAQHNYVSSFNKVADKVFWLPLAADPEVHRKLPLDKLFDIGYVGQIYRSQNLARFSARLTKLVSPLLYRRSQHEDRMRLLTSLSKKYSVLAVSNVWGEDVAKVYNLAKIGFNKSIVGDLNMRVFEVMCCGTMLLTDKIDNAMNILFGDRKHLVLYRNQEELDELVRYYLENEEERERIAQQGQREVLEKHTYQNRMDEMVRTISS